MKIETALKKAIDNGFESEEANLAIEAVAKNYLVSIDLNIIVLDPKFWQALGKAERWSDHDDFCDNCQNGYDSGWNGCDAKHCTCPEKAYIYYMHQMIDHIVEGGTPQSFIESL